MPDVQNAPTGPNRMATRSMRQRISSVASLVLFQVVLGGHGEASGFLGSHRLLRRNEGISAARADLHEYPDRAVPGYQIDLAPPTAVVGFDYPIAFCFEVGAGQLFADIADFSGRRVSAWRIKRHGTAVGIGATGRRSADGWALVPFRPGSGGVGQWHNPCAWRTRTRGIARRRGS